MVKILLTAFDPFGGESINPASIAVYRTHECAGAEIVRLTVPTVFGKSIKTVTDAVKECSPDAVIMVGQAGGRRSVTVERVAVNKMDASIADNEGNIPKNQKVIEGGDDELYATLPIDDIVSAIRDGGVDADVSDSAGTFVCNQLMYGVLDMLRRELPYTVAGFIHVPFMPEQAKNGTPSMELDKMVTALDIAVETVCEKIK